MTDFILVEDPWDHPLWDHFDNWMRSRSGPLKVDCWDAFLEGARLGSERTLAGVRAGLEHVLREGGEPCGAVP